MPPASVESAVCRNCLTAYVGNYCPRCGQSRNTPRFSARNALQNALSGLTNIGNGFGRTVVELLFRPGYMISDYIRGKRAPYFRPFPTLFVIATVYIVLLQLFNTTIPTNTSSTVSNDTVVEKETPSTLDSLTHDVDEIFAKYPFVHKVYQIMSDFVSGNKAVQIALALPLSAVCIRMAFRRRKYNRRWNMTEFIFAEAYIAAQGLIFSILFLPFAVAGGYDYSDDLYGGPIWIFCLVELWDYKQVFRGTWKRTLQRLLLYYIYMLLIAIAIACIVGLLIFRFYV
jgi:hypothetical protein